MVQIDDIMNKNRRIIYEDRLKVLKSDNESIFIKNLNYFFGDWGRGL